MKKALNFFWYDRKWFGKIISCFALLFSISLLAELAQAIADPTAYQAKIAAREQSRADAQAAITAKETAEKEKLAQKTINDLKYAQKCIRYDGAARQLVYAVQDALRNPKSFEHIDTRISPMEKGVNDVVMQYRAENGFGGMTIGTIIAQIDNETCAIISMEISE